MIGDSLIKQMNKVRFVFIASDASDKTKERYIKKCYYYKIPCNTSYMSSEISLAIGKNHIMAIGITDEGFAKSLIAEIERRGVNGKTKS